MTGKRPAGDDVPSGDTRTAGDASCGRACVTTAPVPQFAKWREAPSEERNTAVAPSAVLDTVPGKTTTVCSRLVGKNSTPCHSNILWD
jgi:hypothetical protein